MGSRSVADELSDITQTSRAGVLVRNYGLSRRSQRISTTASLVAAEYVVSR